MQNQMSNRKVDTIFAVSMGVIIALVVLLLTGCTTALDRWQTSMSIYTATNNTIAIAVTEGQITTDQARNYQQLAKVARASLDAWLSTISPDGINDNGASREAAIAAMNQVRAWFARALNKQ